MDQGVGMTLREAREKRGLELVEVEATIRIRARLLEAIENEEWELLPGRAYARGFTRTYADFLGLDGAGLVERHALEAGEGPTPSPLQGVEPIREGGSRPRLTALGAVALALVAVALAVALSVGGNGDSPGLSPAARPGNDGRSPATDTGAVPATASTPARALSLRLTATAEVWVCLLDAAGAPLVAGQILNAGARVGPFRSDSFTVSLGNGEVSMTINGQQASIAETPSPIGYAIARDSAMRELPPAERPTCT